MTPLHDALNTGHIEIVKYFISRGANIANILSCRLKYLDITFQKVLQKLNNIDTPKLTK